MANHQVLSSWFGTATELKGKKSEQKSTCEHGANESPCIDLKVEGDVVRKRQIHHLQLLLEHQVPELKGMIMSIHPTEQDNAVLVQISQPGKS